MKNKDIEKLLKSSDELSPCPNLKERVLKDAESIPVPSTKTARTKNLFLRRFIAIAASVILFAILTLGGTGIYFEDYGQVYLDVNPSISITVNRLNIVNSISYLNSDAEKCFKNVKIKGKSAEKAMETIMEVLDQHNYLESAEVFLSGYSSKNKNMEKLLDKLETKLEKDKQDKGYSYSVNRQKISSEDKDQADKYNISPAKYRLISQIIALSDDYTLLSLKDKTNKELKEILKSLQK